MAKRLLLLKGAAYAEIDVTMLPAERAKMTELAGGKTSVPQIFIGDTHVGGCDELLALESTGDLDRMIAGPEVSGPTNSGKST